MSYSTSWDGGGARRIEKSRQVRPSPAEPEPPRRRESGDTYVTSNSTTALFRDAMGAYGRFHATGNRIGLNRCISMLRRAVQLALPDRPGLSAFSNNLGVALLERHRLEQGGSGPDDLDHALDHLLRAYRKSQTGSPARARALRNLATALETRLALPEPLSEERRARMPAPEALQREMSRTPGIAVTERFTSACESGRRAARVHGPSAGLADLATAVNLLPNVVWGAREGMLDVLAGTPGLASEAAACALDAGQPARAVQLLEHGRAILWRLHLNSRSVHEELTETSPQLAHELDEVHARLEPRMSAPEKGARELLPSVDVRMEGLSGKERWATRVFRWIGGALRSGTEERPPLLQAEVDWDTLSRRVQHPQFTFVEPSYSTDLAPAAEEGPVVYVNVSPWHCDALVVRRDEDRPERIPLPGLTAEETQERAESYLTAISELLGEAREDAVRDVLDWLWRCVAAPVLAALQLPSADSRVWWVPTGALTALPLHAAMPRRSAHEGAGDSLPDRAVSSYAPGLLDLVRAREERDTPAGVPAANRRLLLVAPDTKHLPGAARTHARLMKLLPGDRRTTLKGPAATRRAVGFGLPRHAWCHFDCHAVQDLDHPLGSHLSLHDGPLTISDLADLPPAQAEFAFLAACATAAGGSLVQDEWISLTAALMYSGYQTVVGTLVPVPDGPTARIAQGVYDELVAGGTDTGIRHTHSARALHRALLDERSRRPAHPSAWASFVHYGV